MKKPLFIDKVKDFFTSKHFLYAILILIFCALFSTIIACKYVFFQSIEDNSNISKVTIAAPKTITVVDNLRTERRRKEVSKKVSAIYTPVDDQYIINNLLNVEKYINDIRSSNKSHYEKQKQLELIFDINDSKTKSFVVTFLLYVDNNVFDTVMQKTKSTLNAVLNEGVTEKDFENNAIISIIARNIDSNTTRIQIKVITALIEQVIVPNLVIDENATEIAQKNAMEMINPITVTFNKGENIIKEGELITQIKRDALSKAGYNILQIDWQDILGIFVLTIIAVSCVLAYLRFYEKQLFTRKHISIIAVMTLLTLSLAVILPYNWSVFLLPIPLYTITLSIFLNPRSAFFITIGFLTLITMQLQFSELAIAIFILVSLIIVIAFTKTKFTRRFDLIKLGFIVGSAMLMLIYCVFMDTSSLSLLKDMSSGLLNGLMTGIIILGVIPLFENSFGVITPYGLAELADHNQPLLKRLQFDAPGTFSHSLMVSNLCEAAAEAIDANPVLARVGALYHDIGKIIRPLFFIENQSYNDIQNPHEKLNPRLSKMVITSHTKDGLTLAKEYHLPSVIQDFIIQHHGDSLASYFYNQAILQEGKENVEEEQFRYTGPKPNSKETAILMLADAVESASRTLKDHSQEELDKMINKIISDRLADNQLADSPLTLSDIKVIASTFSRVLRSIHHKRIKYQENIMEELENKVKQKQNSKYEH